MYKLYYQLMLYLISIYAVVVLVSIFKLIVIWLIFDEAMQSTSYYGIKSKLQNYFYLTYMPEPYFEGTNFRILINVFYLIFNFTFVVGFSCVIILIETDLECLYRDINASEISLFTLL